MGRLRRGRAGPDRGPAIFRLEPGFELAYFRAAKDADLEAATWEVGMVLRLHFDIVADECHGLAGLIVGVPGIAVEGDKDGPVQPGGGQGGAEGAVVVVLRQDLERGACGGWAVITVVGAPMNPRLLPQNQFRRGEGGKEVFLRAK